MELKGRINVYVHSNAKTTTYAKVFTVNLNNGTTPFMICLEGLEYVSNFYDLARLVDAPIVISYCWYRPTPAVFAKLEASEQDHVLNGGLLLGELGKIVPQADIVSAEWDWETLQLFNEAMYGRRLQKGK